jgi:hypothetical protein
MRSQSGRLLLHIRLREPAGKEAPFWVPGNKRFALLKPHDSVASAGGGVNAATTTSVGAMTSGRIRIFLN